jgi:hypothetical protein
MAPMFAGITNDTGVVLTILVASLMAGGWGWIFTDLRDKARKRKKKPKK